MSESTLFRQPARAYALLRYFARHRVAANLMMVFVILLGVLAMGRLNTQIFPDVTPGAAGVSVTWQAAGAEAVLDRLTSPLETAILDLDSVDRITSNSRDGGTAINVYFRAGVEFDRAISELRTTIEGVSLPAEADDPVIREYGFSEPVVFLVLTYEGLLEDLRPLAYELERDLKRRGIPEITVYGLAEQALYLDVTPEQLAHHQWTLDTLAQRIRAVNDRYAAGSTGEQGQRRNLITGEQVISAAELAELPIADNLRLGDVMDIRSAGEDPSLRLFFDDKPAIMLQLSRSAALDSLATSDLFKQWQTEVGPTLPDTLGVEVFYDTSEFVRDNLNLLISNGLFGLVFVLVMLFVFLNLRLAFWTAMGIPVAIFGTMTLLYFTGGSLNFFSIFAMLMALGIIVDDAIVVGEESQTLVEQGVARDQAAGIAATHMFPPVLASSLTTIAAFSPLLFVPGVFGELLRPIPVVIIAVIVASLIECFLILPGHLHHSLARRQSHQPGRLRQAIDQRLTWVREGLYRPIIRVLIRQRLFTLMTALSLFILAVGLVTGDIVRFSEDLEVEDDRVQAEARFIEGTAEAEILAFVDTLKAGLEQTAAHFSEQHDGPVLLDLYHEYDLDSRSTFFMARLPGRDDRDFSNSDFLNHWESLVERPMAVERLRIASESGGGSSASQLNLRLVGEDGDRLKAATRALKAALAQRGDLRNIDDSLPDTNRQLALTLTPTARSLGISERELAYQLSAFVDGVLVQSFTRFGEEVDVRVRLDERSRNRLDLVRWLPIQLPGGARVPLADLATFEEREALSTIYRVNGQQSITVTADPVDEQANSQLIQTDIQRTIMPAILTQYGLTAAYETGQDAGELLDNLIFAGWVAAALIFLILAWIFQSYTWPLAVMLSIPLSMTGAIAGHWLMGLDFTFLSIFGLFGLAGIVINGAIVLIVRYREMLSEGYDRQAAIVEACCQRFRPVVLTTMTTVAGLVPILLESSVQAQLVRSMATSLAFGLAYGSVLVLLIVPCLLSYLQSMGDNSQRLLRWLLGRTAQSKSP
ncbi:MAG: efflux RND transporter permease subunit [Saccharospirillum sp.]